MRFRTSITEKKSANNPSKPTKNYLKDLQKHNADYNKKHPHSLAPMLKKDAGNVEYNNNFFNNSVDYSKVTQVGDSADTASVSFAGAGDSSGGDACAGGESLHRKRDKKPLSETTTIIRGVVKGTLIEANSNTWRVDVKLNDGTSAILQINADDYDSATKWAEQYIRAQQQTRENWVDAEVSTIQPAEQTTKEK